MNAKACLKGKRSHWGIENRQHWVLDIAFCENIRQVRKDHAPENFAVLRHSAVNLLKQKKKRSPHQAFVGWLGQSLTVQDSIRLKYDYPILIVEIMIYNK